MFDVDYVSSLYSCLSSENNADIIVPGILLTILTQFKKLHLGESIPNIPNMSEKGHYSN